MRDKDKIKKIIYNRRLSAPKTVEKAAGRQGRTAPNPLSIDALCD